MDTPPNEQAFSASNTNTVSVQALPIKRPNSLQKYDNSTSLSALSSVFTDQRPSTSLVSNWTPSSFGSLTSIDQFFLNSKKTSNSSLNWLGMTGGSNSVDSPDPVIQDAILKEKVKKDLEIYGRQLYNDSSLGLYHMSEHIRKRVPQIVEDKKVLTNLTKDVEITLEDMKDSCEVIESMPKIPCFNNISEMLKRTLGMIEVKNKDIV
ncbi:BLOC-1-related complex subunit 8 homolog [Rhizophagus clarus]|uniref:BLOC-1-related complex subunit 8 homolog n=1 Tax=Rhizophagus clarus TaxID=94130 RepID=A0A8H3LIT6_9GLOM|nr:BLOC-1-related complex subunit 8 homolog [Rhizophagus clarus]